jgi:hypothetical protein
MFLGLLDTDPFSPIVRIRILPFLIKCAERIEICLQSKILTKIFSKNSIIYTEDNVHAGKL